MLDRQKLETILVNRFPGATNAQVAAAANAIMGLDDRRSSASTAVYVSTWINAPVKRVFEMFTDVEHAAEHVSGIVNIEMLTIGPFGLGTRWRETRQIFGRLDGANMEVTAFERYWTYTISHHKGGVRIDTVFTFAPAGAGTQVTIELALDGAGLPPGFLTPLNLAIAGRVRHVLERDLTDLKGHLEGTEGSASF